MKLIAIETEYITLGQLLKLTDCVSTGGQVKPFLQETAIRVNDQPENRRGRKKYQQLLNKDLRHKIEKVGAKLRARMPWLQEERA